MVLAVAGEGGRNALCLARLGIAVTIVELIEADSAHRILEDRFAVLNLGIHADSQKWEVGDRFHGAAAR